MEQPSCHHIIESMESLQDNVQRENLMRFFKTGKGQYGYGDHFLGIKVPQTREIVRHSKDLPIEEIPTLLKNHWHEVRLCGFLLLVNKFERLATKRLTNDITAIHGRDTIVKMYLNHAQYANNWDLVDLTAPKILGHWIMLPTFFPNRSATPSLQEDCKLSLLDSLAASNNLWEQRMSMVCTLKTMQLGEPFYCLRYAEKHLHHSHDLMQKATGWMLRELGKRISIELLRDFLRQHAHEMPRTMLRYSIEKMQESERHHWMGIEHA